MCREGGAPTNIADERLLTLADIQYRAIFNEHHEFSPHITANLTNSGKAASAPADPWLGDIYLPYTYKSQLFDKPWRMTATPSYEVLYMDPNSSGTKSQELTSYLMTFDNSLTINKDWTTTLSLEYRSDTSQDPSSQGPADLSGNKYTFRAIQTLFVDKARKQVLIPIVDYIRNPAKGSDKTYNRYDLGLTYVRPAYWATLWNVGLSYYSMAYTGTVNPNRVDSDTTLTTGFSKPIRDWVTWGLSGTYTKNASTDPNYAYNKLVVFDDGDFYHEFLNCVKLSRDNV